MTEVSSFHFFPATKFHLFCVAKCFFFCFLSYFLTLKLPFVIIFFYFEIIVDSTRRKKKLPTPKIPCTLNPVSTVVTTCKTQYHNQNIDFDTINMPSPYRVFILPFFVPTQVFLHLLTHHSYLHPKN